MNSNEILSLSRTILDPNTPIVFPYGFNFEEDPLDTFTAINERKGCLVICDKNRIYHFNPRVDETAQQIHEYAKGTHILSVEEFPVAATFHLLGKENNTFFVDEFKKAKLTRRVTTLTDLPEGTKSLALVADRKTTYQYGGHFLWLLMVKTNEIVIKIIIRGDVVSKKIPEERTISIKNYPRLILSHGLRNSIFCIPETGEIEFFPLIDNPHSHSHMYRYGAQNQCLVEDVIAVSQSDPTESIGCIVTLLQSTGTIAIAQVVDPKIKVDPYSFSLINQELCQIHDFSIPSPDPNHPFCSVDHVPILYSWQPSHGKESVDGDSQTQDPSFPFSHIFFAASKTEVFAYGTDDVEESYQQIGNPYQIGDLHISSTHKIQKVQFTTILDNHDILILLTCIDTQTTQLSIHSLSFHTRSQTNGEWRYRQQVFPN